MKCFIECDGSTVILREKINYYVAIKISLRVSRILVMTFKNIGPNQFPELPKTEFKEVMPATVVACQPSRQQKQAISALLEHEHYTTLPCDEIRKQQKGDIKKVFIRV